MRKTGLPCPNVIMKGFFRTGQQETKGETNSLAGFRDFRKLAGKGIVDNLFVKTMVQHIYFLDINEVRGGRISVIGELLLSIIEPDGIKSKKSTYDFLISGNIRIQFVFLN